MTRGSAVAAEPMWLLTPTRPGRSPGRARRARRSRASVCERRTTPGPGPHPGIALRLHRQVQQDLLAGTREGPRRRRAPAQPGQDGARDRVRARTRCAAAGASSLPRSSITMATRGGPAARRGASLGAARPGRGRWRAARAALRRRRPRGRRGGTERGAGVGGQDFQIERDPEDEGEQREEERRGRDSAAAAAQDAEGARRPCAPERRRRGRSRGRGRGSGPGLGRSPGSTSTRSSGVSPLPPSTCPEGET